LPPPVAVDQWNVSLKLAHSGVPEARRLRPAAIARFRDLGAWFKFVVGAEQDVDEVLLIQARYGLPSARVLLMPVGLRREELEAARRVAQALGAREHAVLQVDLRRFGGSALTADLAIPAGRDPAAMTDIPPTYVPARNTVFLALALAWAETLGAEDLFIGVNALDYSGYPDCRPEYIEAFERMANLATRAGVEGRSRFRI